MSDTDSRTVTDPPCVPKLSGADVELGNFITGDGDDFHRQDAAALALIRQIRGGGERRDARRWCQCDDCLRERSGSSSSTASVWNQSGSGQSGWGQLGWGQVSAGPGTNPQDWGRRFLPNGGCIYVDLSHLELCIPEVRSARDHVAAWHAMLHLAREAMHDANALRSDRSPVRVLVNNSDGLGHAWGGHLNMLVTRTAWDDIFRRRLQYLTFLATYQVSSIIYTSQGKVGAENGAPDVPYQITQRGDFFEELSGPQTTYRRPIVNSRDEALCGASDHTRRQPNDPELARLHCIFYDSTLCHVSTFLKVGVMQIILAMIEARCVDPKLVLDDALGALGDWGHDPELRTTATLSDGRQVTAVELSFLFLEAARSFVDSGRCEGIVPEAETILALWEDTLMKLAARDFDALVGRLDWVLKRTLIERTLEQNRDLDWSSAAIKHLDHIYSDLDDDNGLYWRFEGGLVEHLVSQADIEERIHVPPHDTRAWTRGMLIERAGGSRVTDVDWDYITLANEGWPQTEHRTLHLPDPLGAGRSETGWAFEGGVDPMQVAETLGLEEPTHLTS